ncbi:response regulator [Alteromonas oceanisediminis]|uniref:response regulator n=1 Tax=Alteromonas oceanisediminis TaxID=2836180 RepID=UPI001BD9DD60|nr:response regulator transcription factor [Alteromonas oceanisediminis]MBT0587001.1 response regulator transcription factor [Alteromonas oceanisediminis]
MIEIVSLDDHPLFSLGLKESLQSLSQDFKITTLSQPQRTLDYLKQRPAVDLLILDVSMPEIDGISFMHAMLNRSINTPVVIMSAVEDLTVFQSALSLGAMGIIPKSLPVESIADLIRRACQGEVVIPERLKRSLMRVSKFAQDSTESVLSKRQLEILKMVQAGLSNSGIASVLFISEVTVKSHLQNIFRILGAKNRVDCVRKAENLNILTKFY